MPRWSFKRMGRRPVAPFTVGEWLISKCSNVYCKTPGAPVTTGPDPYEED